MCSKKFLLLGIIFIGAVLRFYKLDWGEGNFFHPDEYHIAGAVNRLSFPFQMNPHLFTYGSFTVYLIYFTKLALAGLNLKIFNLDPILLGRFYSALFSTLTIAIVFLIAKKLVKNNWGPYLAALLTALTPGLIQQAHFATPESILTFWLLTTLYLVMNWHEQKKVKFLYLAAVTLGLALATKVVAALFLPILIIPTQNPLRLLRQPRKALIHLIKLVILPLLVTGLVFFLVFPYAVLDYPAFRGSMNYETGVGEGNPVVFYTRQFIETTPIFFQIQKIFPYALGPGIEILGILGFLAICLVLAKGALRKKLSVISYQLLVVVIVFLLYFLPSAFLFAKWTRFMAPAFPFFAIFTAYFLSRIKNRTFLVISYLLLVISSLWTMMFFSIYLRPDIRVAATAWTKINLPAESTIFTEQGNMIEAPMGGNFKKLSLDFYGLEENPEIRRLVPAYLAQADYFIVQSRRLFSNHQRLPALYPQTARFYDLLFSGQLGFMEIKEFRFFVNDEVGEETWSVFDHPVIRIYQKTAPFTQDYYRDLLKY